MENKCVKIIKEKLTEYGISADFENCSIINCELIDKDLFPITKNNHYKSQLSIKLFKENKDSILYPYNLDCNGDLKLTKNAGESIREKVCCIKYLYPYSIEEKFTEFENWFNKKNSYTDIKSFLDVVDRKDIDRREEEIEKYYPLLVRLYALTFLDLNRNPNSIQLGYLNSLHRVAEKFIEIPKLFKFYNKKGKMYYKIQKTIEDETKRFCGLKKMTTNNNDIVTFFMLCKLVATKKEIDKISDQQIKELKERIYKSFISDEFTNEQYKKWLTELYILLFLNPYSNDCKKTFFEENMGEIFKQQCHRIDIITYDDNCVFMSNDNIVCFDYKILFSLSKRHLIVFYTNENEKYKNKYINTLDGSLSIHLDLLKKYNRGLIIRNKIAWGAHNNVELFKNYI